MVNGKRRNKDSRMRRRVLNIRISLWNNLSLVFHCEAVAVDVLGEFTIISFFAIICQGIKKEKKDTIIIIQTEMNLITIQA